MRLACLAAASALALAACGQPADPTATASTEVAEAPVSGPAETPADAALAASTPLPDRLDCLRARGGVLIVGHRGGPTRDYPESAIETFQRTYDAGTHALETDIRETKDNKLVLLHDDDLDRTTTGTGLVTDHTLAEIQALKLRTGSKTTDFHPATLEAALDWAVKTNALLELDKKRSASYAPIIAAVRAAHAENNILLITYTDEQAIAVHKTDPDLVINASIGSVDQLDRLVAGGVKTDRLLAWTGNTAPDPVLWKALATRGVESIFGANGPKETALDTLYWQDRDGSEFHTLVSGGLSLLVTGLTDKTSRELGAEVGKAKACGF